MPRFQVCGQCAAPVDVNRIQRVPSLPYSFEQTDYITLGFCSLRVGTCSLISAAAALGDSFSHNFVHLFYYPALAFMAVLFASFKLNMAPVTIAVHRLCGGQPDRRGWNSDRGKGRGGVAGQDSHHVCGRWGGQPGNQVRADQTRRRRLPGGANPELTATLEAMSQLSRSIMWELKHPISMGGIYEGRELSRALRSHASSFTNITSVPAELTQSGVEPVSGFPMTTRSAVTASRT